MDWFLTPARQHRATPPPTHTEQEDDGVPAYPGVLRIALASLRKEDDDDEEEGTAVVTQDEFDSDDEDDWDWRKETRLSRSSRDLLCALTRAEATTLASGRLRTSRRPSSSPRVRFAVSELGAVDFGSSPPQEADDCPARLLTHLTAALESAREARASADSCAELLELARVLESADLRAQLSANRQAAAAFLATELRELTRGDGSGPLAPNSICASRVAVRHAELLSSVLRKELKRQLNDTIGIAPGTGSIKFNFDDPAALLHRALEVLHEHGGPSEWVDSPRLADPHSLEDAEDTIALASAHAFALSVLDNARVRDKKAAGHLDKLACLADIVYRACEVDDARQQYNDAERTPRRRLLLDDDATNSRRTRKEIAHTATTCSRNDTVRPLNYALSLISLAPLRDLAGLADELRLAAPGAHALAEKAVAFLNNREQIQRSNSGSRKRKHARISVDQPSIFIFPDVGPYEPVLCE